MVICEQVVVAHCFREEVAAFIAAASPEAVLGLLDEIAAVEAERDEVREAVRRLAGALEGGREDGWKWKFAFDALADPVVKRIVEGG